MSWTENKKYLTSLRCWRLKSDVCWDVALFSPMDWKQRVAETICLYECLQDRRGLSSVLKMEETRSLELLVSAYQITRPHSPKTPIFTHRYNLSWLLSRKLQRQVLQSDDKSRFFCSTWCRCRAVEQWECCMRGLLHTRSGNFTDGSWFTFCIVRVLRADRSNKQSFNTKELV